LPAWDWLPKKEDWIQMSFSKYNTRRFEKDPPLKEGEIREMEIIGVGEKGDGIGKIEGFVVIVPNTKTGDKVQVKITAVRGKVSFGEVVGEGSETEAAEASAEETMDEPSEESSEDEEASGEEEGSEEEKSEESEDDAEAGKEAEEATEEAEETAEESEEAAEDEEAEGSEDAAKSEEVDEAEEEKKE